MTNKTSAIHAALPAIPPKPRIAATIAMIRNTTAHFNNSATPSASMERLKNTDIRVFKARRPIPAFVYLPSHFGEVQEAVITLVFWR